MNQKSMKLTALLGLSMVVLAVGVGVYATQTESPSTGGKARFQMMKQFGSGEMVKSFKHRRFGSGHQTNQEEKRGKFGFPFLDYSSLTESQKSEIQKLQEEREEAIKKINDEFFDKLKKFISEEKWEDYENFVANHEKIKGMPYKK